MVPPGEVTFWRSTSAPSSERCSSSPDPATVFWEAEYQLELYRRALQLLQNDFAPATWRAFWETVVQGRPTADVARELGTTENAIYAGRFRVLRRLRQELTGLVE